MLFGVLFFCILTLRADSFWSAAFFLAGTFLIGAADALRRKEPVPGLVWLFSLLPLWGVVQISVPLSVYRQPTAVEILAALSYFCVALVASGVSAGSVEGVRQVLLWFAFVLALGSTLLNLTALDSYWPFPVEAFLSSTMGPFVYHNHWAVFVEVALPLAIYSALRVQGGRVWLYASMAASLYGSVVVSASRSGVIVCSLELLAVPVLTMRGQRSSIAAVRTVVPVFAVVLLGVWIAGPEVVWARFQEELTVGRADWNRTSLTMLAARPWRGFGLGNWTVAYPQFAHFDLGLFVNQAHNDWLQWAVEGGVFYALIWAAIAVMACRQAWRFPWAAGVPAVFVQALMDYPFSRPAVAGWVFTVLGLSLAAARGEEKRRRGRDLSGSKEATTSKLVRPGREALGRPVGLP